MEIRGLSLTDGKPPISITDPRKKKGKDKNRVTLIIIGTETAKDTIFARLQIEDAGHGYVHFSESLDYDFFKQLCSEQCLTKYSKGRPYRVWAKKRTDARNEALDLFVGNLAVIELLKPKFEMIGKNLKKEIQAAERPQPVNRPVKKKIRERGVSWVNGWK